MSNRDDLTKELRRRVNTLLAEGGMYPEALNDAEWAWCGNEVLDVNDAFGNVQLNEDNLETIARDVLAYVLPRRSYAVGYVVQRSTAPRRRAEPREVRDEGPAHWPLYWQREMERFRPQQREALQLVGPIPQRKVWKGFDHVTDGSGVVVDLMVKADPLEPEDFIPEAELGDYLKDMAAKYQEGEPSGLEYVVEPSREHPQGTARVLFHWGYWRKDAAENPEGGEFPEENPLLRLKQIAWRIAQEVFLPEADCVAWLLCDRTPHPPIIRGELQIHRDMFDPGQDRLKFTLEVHDPLVVMPDQLRDLYAHWRRQVFGEAAARPWSVRMQSFVEWAKAAGHTWPKRHELWNEWYPDHPYKNWHSMQRAYSEYSRRVS